MSQGKRFGAVLLLACLPATLGGAEALATRVVSIRSTIAITGEALTGKVKSPNHACVEGRKVVVKQAGYGRIASTTSSSAGLWEIHSPVGHGDPPWALYAEVKPRSEGTAGTIYRCLGARSRTVKISGG